MEPGVDSDDLHRLLDRHQSEGLLALLLIQQDQSRQRIEQLGIRTVARLNLFNLVEELPFAWIVVERRAGA